MTNNTAVRRPNVDVTPTSAVIFHADTAAAIENNRLTKAPPTTKRIGHKPLTKSEYRFRCAGHVLRDTESIVPKEREVLRDIAKVFLLNRESADNRIIDDVVASLRIREKESHASHPAAAGGPEKRFDNDQKQRRAPEPTTQVFLPPKFQGFLVSEKRVAIDQLGAPVSTLRHPVCGNRPPVAH